MAFLMTAKRQSDKMVPNMKIGMSVNFSIQEKKIHSLTPISVYGNQAQAIVSAFQQWQRWSELQAIFNTVVNQWNE